MSLINQMLQDLDARRAAHGVGTRLPNDVRPLPKARMNYWPLAIALGLGLMVVFGVAFLLLRNNVVQGLGSTDKPVAEAGTPAVPAAVVTPPPVAVPAAAGSVPDAGKALGGVEVSLRMADFIEPVEDAVVAAKPVEESPPHVPALAVAKAAVHPVEPSRAKPLLAANATPSPAPLMPTAKAPERSGEASGGKTPSAPVIERTPAGGSARERAENEYRKAVAAVNQGRMSIAMDGLREVLHQDGLHVASRQLLVKLLLEAKNTDEAMQVLRDGISGQPAQLGWAMSLARLQVDRGELDDAWKTLDHSLTAAGNNPDYLGFAANVLQRLGRHDEAAEQYRKATRISPADGRWWLGLGWCLDAQGQTAEARDAFVRARQSGNLSPELITLIDQKLR